MKIVFTAQAFGFGPVSKMLTISQGIKNADKIFIGDGIALDFVNKQGKGVFNDIIDKNKTCLNHLKEVIKSADCLVIVMDPEIAYLAHTLKKVFYFIDSLFGFWYSKEKDAFLVKKFNNIVKKYKYVPESEFKRLSVHEKILLAHYLSNFSFIQNFMDVEKRINNFTKHGAKNLATINPISKLNINCRFVPLNNGKLLINLGGMENFLVKDLDTPYIKLIDRLSKDILTKIHFIKEVIICSGLYTKPIAKKINGKKILRTFYSKKVFISMLSKCQFYLSSPGMTGFYEALYVNRPTLYLPEQHSSQYYNLKKLKKTFLRDYCIGLFNIIGEKKLSQDDYECSCQIIRYINSIVKKPVLYKKLLKNVLKKISHMNNLNYSVYKQNCQVLIKSLETSINLKLMYRIIQKNEANCNH